MGVGDQAGTLSWSSYQHDFKWLTKKPIMVAQSILLFIFCGNSWKLRCSYLLRQLTCKVLWTKFFLPGVFFFFFFFFHLTMYSHAHSCKWCLIQYVLCFVSWSWHTLLWAEPASTRDSFSLCICCASGCPSGQRSWNMCFAYIIHDQSILGLLYMYWVDLLFLSVVEKTVYLPIRL